MKKEDLEKAIGEVFNSPKPQTERKFKGVRGCITYEHKDINDITHCGDIKCSKL